MVSRIPPVGVPISVTREKRGKSLRVKVRWTVDGRQTGTTKTFPKSPDREERISQFIESIRMTKRTRTVPRLTIREFVGKATEAALVENLAPTTRTTYLSALNRQVLPFLGDTEIASLDVQRVRQFARQLDAASTRRNALSVLSRICNLAVDTRYLRENPVHTARVDRGTVQRAERRILRSQDEADQLMEAVEAKSARYADVLRVTLGCALRIGEVAGLEVGDYDQSTHLLTVDRQVDVRGRVRDPKHGSNRKVPVSPQIHQILVSYQDAKEEGSSMFGSRGGRLSIQTMRKQLEWNSLVAEAGLPDFRIHDLRHTGLTWLCKKLAAKKEPISMISTIAGHKSVATTESYIHTVEDDLERLAGHLWD